MTLLSWRRSRRHILKALLMFMCFRIESKLGEVSICILPSEARKSCSEKPHLGNQVTCQHCQTRTLCGGGSALEPLEHCSVSRTTDRKTEGSVRWPLGRATLPTAWLSYIAPWWRPSPGAGDPVIHRQECLFWHNYLFFSSEDGAHPNVGARVPSRSSLVYVQLIQVGGPYFQ